MHYRVILATAVVAAAAAFTPALASAGTGGSPNQDYVVGGGQNNPPSGLINHFAISAHSNPDGSSPFGEGHFVGTSNGPPVDFFEGPVVCLNVVGNSASIVFAATNQHNEPPFLAGDLMFAQDNGNPQGGQSPDLVINTELNATQLQAFQTFGCPPPRAIPPDRTLTAGNIVVNDAP